MRKSSTVPPGSTSRGRDRRCDDRRGDHAGDLWKLLQDIRRDRFDIFSRTLPAQQSAQALDFARDNPALALGLNLRAV